MTRPWLPNEIIRTTFDKRGEHRFYLNCTWERTKKKALFIMLNPSLANQETCDPTVDKCIHFAKKKNCGSIEIVNLFSLISPNPNELLSKEVKSHSIDSNEELKVYLYK